MIPPADQNLREDFGRTPPTFRRTEFENFCKQQDVPEVAMLTRSFFSRMGKYPTAAPFPNPNDIAFWNHCVANGADLVRVRSFAYHFQGMSNPVNDKNR